jgi:hypothetical protein
MRERMRIGKKNANNSALLVGGSVYGVKATCGQRRRGKKKEGHKTDQECAVRLHTIITATNHTRVYFGADFFSSLILFFLFTRALT